MEINPLGGRVIVELDYKERAHLVNNAVRLLIDAELEEVVLRPNDRGTVDQIVNMLQNEIHPTSTLNIGIGQTGILATCFENVAPKADKQTRKFCESRADKLRTFTEDFVRQQVIPSTIPGDMLDI